MLLKNVVLAGISIVTIASMSINADNVAPSVNPPGSLPAAKVPQFVMIGFDDNYGLDGMQWVVDLLKDKKNPAGKNNAKTYDGTPARAAFFCNTKNGPAIAVGSDLAKLYLSAYNAGHEIGNHTQTHPNNYNYDTTTWELKGILMNKAQWNTEITNCKSDLVSFGIPTDKINGFRTPFLESAVETFDAVATTANMVYDCSIEEGYQPTQDGKNFLWPYTMDAGCPGNETLVGFKSKWTVGTHAGLWEIASYAIIAPPDDQCASYGIPSGFRNKLKTAVSYFDVASGKITGLDYNTWSAFKMTKAEMVATLKYTFDLRYNNNRSPMTIGLHSQYYGQSGFADLNPPNATLTDLQAAVQEFVTYALSKPDARIVPPMKIIQWMRSPVALDNVVVPVDTTNPSENLVELAGWDTWVDNYGSTVDTGIAMVSGGIVKVKYLKKKQPSDTDYTGISFSGYVEKQLTTVNYIKLTYKSDQLLDISLPMQELVDLGCIHFYRLPIATSWSTVLLKPADFKQPDWTEAVDKKNLDLSKVDNVTFSAVDDEGTAEVAGTVEIQNLILYNYEQNTPIATTLQKNTSVFSFVDLRHNLLSLGVSTSGVYSISVFSVNGKKIVDLGTRAYNQGIHTLSLTGNPLSAKLILIAIRGKNFTQVVKTMVK